MRTILRGGGKPAAALVAGVHARQSAASTHGGTRRITTHPVAHRTRHLGGARPLSDPVAMSAVKAATPQKTPAAAAAAGDIVRARSRRWRWPLVCKTRALRCSRVEHAPSDDDAIRCWSITCATLPHHRRQSTERQSILSANAAWGFAQEWRRRARSWRSARRRRPWRRRAILVRGRSLALAARGRHLPDPWARSCLSSTPCGATWPKCCDSSPAGAGWSCSRKPSLASRVPWRVRAPPGSCSGGRDSAAVAARLATAHAPGARRRARRRRAARGGRKRGVARTTASPPDLAPCRPGGGDAAATSRAATGARRLGAFAGATSRGGRRPYSAASVHWLTERGAVVARCGEAAHGAQRHGRRPPDRCQPSTRCQCASSSPTFRSRSCSATARQGVGLLCPDQKAKSGWLPQQQSYP